MLMPKFKQRKERPLYLVYLPYTWSDKEDRLIVSEVAIKPWWETVGYYRAWNHSMLVILVLAIVLYLVWPSPLLHQPTMETAWVYRIQSSDVYTTYYQQYRSQSISFPGPRWEAGESTRLGQPLSHTAMVRQIARLDAYMATRSTEDRLVCTHHLLEPGEEDAVTVPYCHLEYYPDESIHTPLRLTFYGNETYHEQDNAVRVFVKETRWIPTKQERMQHRFKQIRVHRPSTGPLPAIIMDLTHNPAYLVQSMLDEWSWLKH